MIPYTKYYRIPRLTNPRPEAVDAMQKIEEALAQISVRERAVILKRLLELTSERSSA